MIVYFTAGMCKHSPLALPIADVDAFSSVLYSHVACNSPELELFSARTVRGGARFLTVTKIAPLEYPGG